MLSLFRKLMGGKIPIGQIAFTTPGTYNWVVPSGVKEINAVLVGAGERNPNGGRGGGLHWGNGIPVTPGQTVVVRVASGTDGTVDGSDSRITIGSEWMRARGGANAISSAVGGGFDKSAGFTGALFGGGNGGNAQNTRGGGGGGGYTGRGGNGYSDPQGPAEAGSGGAGGGSLDQGGGGVGIMGRGATGLQNQGGSGGQNSGPGGIGGNGGNYGGGGAYHPSNSSGGFPGTGAVRIIWGKGRAFPSTLTGDL